MEVTLAEWEQILNLAKRENNRLTALESAPPTAEGWTRVLDRLAALDVDSVTLFDQIEALKREVAALKTWKADVLCANGAANAQKEADKRAAGKGRR